MYTVTGFGSLSPTDLAKVAASTKNCGSILLVQKTLLELGFNPGPLDGIYGPKTEAACKAFALSKGFLYAAPPQGDFCIALAAAYAEKMGIAIPGGVTLPAGFPSLPGGAVPVYPPTLAIEPPEAPPAAPPPAAPAAAPAASSGPMAWWSKQTTPVKAATVGVGALVLLGLAKAIRGTTDSTTVLVPSRRAST